MNYLKLDVFISFTLDKITVFQMNIGHISDLIKYHFINFIY